MSSSHLPKRFSATGLLAAVGAHGVVIAGMWSFAAPAPLTPPATLMAQLIAAPAPAPAEPVAEPPRARPVTQPPPRRAKPPPRPRPRPRPIAVAPAPQVVAARSAEPGPTAPAPVEREVAPIEVAPPSPATPPALAPAPALAAPVPAAPAVTLPRFDADYLDNPTPAYPPLSRRMREEGKVMLRIFVEPDGRPSRVEVSAASGSPRLDRAAEAAVWRWKFVPARRGSEPVGAWVLVPIVFSLRG
jgi:protein TonB